MIRRHVLVSGVVQGVGYRWSLRERAEALGVAGWAANRPDGTVEAEIEGSESAVDALLDWAGVGPSAAVVTAIEVVELDPRGDHGFRIAG